jgi:hypothetical protein
MYIFSFWFQELMEHLKLCNGFDMNIIKEAIENDNILKGRLDIYYKYPEFITPHLSLNENAISILDKYPQYICWDNLSMNINGVSLLIKNFININWFWLSKNTNAIDLILSNLDKLIFIKLKEKHCKTYNQHINWYLLLTNPYAINIIKLYTHEIDWNILSNINHFKTIEYLNENLNKINWTVLSFNNGALPILNENIDKIDWFSLSLQPFAIDILTKHTDKINWDTLSLNEHAIPLLKQNIDKINWSAIMFNKNGAEIIEKYIDNIIWTNWIFYSELKYYLNDLDDLTYVYGSEYNLTYMELTSQLEENYKYNLNYFNKCFVYKDLINIRDNEIINYSIDFYQPNKYILLLRDKQNCEPSEMDNYKQTFHTRVKDKPLNILMNEIIHYYGPPLYSPVYALMINTEFLEILKINPIKVFWIFDKIIPYIDTYFISNIIFNNDFIELDYQYLSIQRTNLLREELMMKTLHPSRIEKWLNEGLTIEDL